MSEFAGTFSRLLLRLLLASPLFAYGFYTLAHAEGGVLAAGSLLIALGAVLAGVLIIASPVAQVLAEGWGSLFYPGERLRKKLPMYSIPESRASEGEYEEALELYEALAEEYPEEVQPQIKMLEIIIGVLGDGVRAAAVYKRGLEHLESKKHREELTHAYEVLRTRLLEAPAWDNTNRVQHGMAKKKGHVEDDS